jgi:hypothetical protein
MGGFASSQSQNSGNQANNANSGSVNRPLIPSQSGGPVPTYPQPTFPPGPVAGSIQTSYLPPVDGAKGQFRPPMSSQQGPIVGGVRTGPVNSHPGMLTNSFGAMNLQVCQ